MTALGGGHLIEPEWSGVQGRYILSWALKQEEMGIRIWSRETVAVSEYNFPVVRLLWEKTYGKTRNRYKTPLFYKP